MTPLEMAQNAAEAVERNAHWSASDPLAAYVARAGSQGRAAAEIAGHMALVSIATDLHRIADVIELGPYPLEEQKEDGA